MPDLIGSEGVPELKKARVLRSEGERLQDRLPRRVEAKFEVNFEQKPAESGTYLLATATYGVRNAELEGKESVYYRSSITQRFDFAGSLENEIIARSAIELVWPYIRQSVETLAAFHRVPLRGVPLILEPSRQAHESAVQAQDGEEPMSSLSGSES